MPTSKKALLILAEDHVRERSGNMLTYKDELRTTRNQFIICNIKTIMTKLILTKLEKN